jgi:hypothetical protein
MAIINIVRTNIKLPSDKELESASKLLFDCFKGFTLIDNRRWRKLWKMLIEKEPGEMLVLDFKFPRNPRFHRKFFALLNVGFDAWEPGRKHKTYKGMAIEKDFEQFREDVIILAGFYEQTFDLRGHMKLKAKSISFANMDDEDFNKLYSAVADVLLREVCTRYAGREELDNVVEQITGFL